VGGLVCADYFLQDATYFKSRTRYTRRGARYHAMIPLKFFRREDRMISKSALAVLLCAASSGTYAAPLNLTGTWQPKYWTLKISLHQDGDRVWGTGGAKDFWFRGAWDGKRYVIVANNFDPKRAGACKPRGVFTLTGTTVANLSTLWKQPEGRQLKGPWTRQSPDPGPAVDYPYATELNFCGVLQTYELVFGSASDQLQGGDWPILAAVAEMLKKNASLKIQVAGHTDAVGDAARNQQLSERRAATVKKALAEKYGADAARIATKGWGADQPIEDNKTEDGRALNRRVEITVAR
jgi:outer membrane protein OmpA-like peptidoglycan-associated protein